MLQPGQKSSSPPTRFADADDDTHDDDFADHDDDYADHDDADADSDADSDK